MSKSRKKLSLLIPKHQNKTAMEIAQMYVTQIKSENNPSNEPQILTKTKEIHDSFDEDNQIPLINPSLLTMPQKSFMDSQETAAKNLIFHVCKSNEILTSFLQKESKLINTICSMFLLKPNNEPSYKEKTSEIIFNFKAEALSLDKKISEVQEENKKLKEKLALATLEEVDERIKRESPANRIIEKQSNKNLFIDKSIILVEKIYETKTQIGLKFLIQHGKVVEADLDQEFDSEVFSQVGIGLCQKIVNEKKKLKKFEAESRKILMLKKEISARLKENIENFKKK